MAVEQQSLRDNRTAAVADLQHHLDHNAYKKMEVPPCGEVWLAGGAGGGVRSREGQAERAVLRCESSAVLDTPGCFGCVSLRCVHCCCFSLAASSSWLRVTGPAARPSTIFSTQSNTVSLLASPLKKTTDISDHMPVDTLHVASCHTGTPRHMVRLAAPGA